MEALRTFKNDLEVDSERLPADRHPVAVYLISIRSGGSRRVQLSAHRRIAELIGICIDRVAWHRFHYQHVAAIAGRLAEEYNPSTANRMSANPLLNDAKFIQS